MTDTSSSQQGGMRGIASPLPKCDSAARHFFFLMLMYKLQSTEDSRTWLVVRIRSAEDGHSSIQQGAGNQRCSQTTGADKNIKNNGSLHNSCREHSSSL